MIQNRHHADPPGTPLALSDRLAGNQSHRPLYARGGPILRGRYKDAKKCDLAATCASLCNGQGIVEAEIREKATAWLPDAMRFDGIEKAARTPLRSSFTEDETGVDPDVDEDTDLDTGDDAVIDHEEEEDFSQAA